MIPPPPPRTFAARWSTWCTTTGAGQPRERGNPRAHEAAPVGDREGGLDLLDALAGLPERRRACVVLRYYLDLTETETAAALGISVGTVKSQTHKALAQLRGNLSDQLPPVATPTAAPEGPERED